MKRAISPVIASILVLIIAITITGSVYMLIKRGVSILGSSFIEETQESSKTIKKLWLISSVDWIDLQEDIVLYMKFDDCLLGEDMNGKYVSDYSGYGNSGTAHGNVKCVKGVIGNALEFDGVSSYIEVPDNPSLDLDKGFTVVAWIRGEDVDTSASDRIVSKESGANTNYAIGLSSTTNKLWIKFNDHSWTGNTVVGDRNWHIVVFSAEKIGSNVVIDAWVDGKEDISDTSVTGIIPTNNVVLRIGMWSESVDINCGFNGIIDEVRIYSRRLTDEEKEDLYYPLHVMLSNEGEDTVDIEGLIAEIRASDQTLLCSGELKLDKTYKASKTTIEPGEQLKIKVSPFALGCYNLERGKIYNFCISDGASRYCKEFRIV